MKILGFNRYVFFFSPREHVVEGDTFKMVLLMAGTQESIALSRRVLATWCNHLALLINR